MVRVGPLRGNMGGPEQLAPSLNQGYIRLSDQHHSPSSKQPREAFSDPATFDPLPPLIPPNVARVGGTTSRVLTRLLANYATIIILKEVPEIQSKVTRDLTAIASSKRLNYRGRGWIHHADCPVRKEDIRAVSVWTPEMQRGAWV